MVLPLLTTMVLRLTSMKSRHKCYLLLLHDSSVIYFLQRIYIVPPTMEQIPILWRIISQPQATLRPPPAMIITDDTPGCDDISSSRVIYGGSQQGKSISTMVLTVCWKGVYYTISFITRRILLRTSVVVTKQVAKYMAKATFVYVVPHAVSPLVLLLL